MGKKKDKKKQATDAVEQADDIDDLVAAIESRSTSSKQKKGKKKKEVDNWKDEVQDEITKLTLNEEKQDVNNETSNKREKKGKKKKNMDWDDESRDYDAADSDTEKRNTQSKKGKKNNKKAADDWENDIENEITLMGSGGQVTDDKQKEEDAPTMNTKNKQGKKSKKKKGDDDDWQADIEKELEMISTGQEPAEDVDNQENKSKMKGRKEKRKKDDDRSIEADDEAADVATKVNKEEDVVSSKVKGKKSRKKKDDDDWQADIEKELEMIATGQEPAEDVDNQENKSKMKGKKEKKKKEDDRKEANDVTASSASSEQKPTEDDNTQVKGKKQGKKGRKKKDDDDWENEVSQELAKIESGEPVEPDSKPESESKQGKKKKAKKETNIEQKSAKESLPDASATTSEAVAKSSDQVLEPSEKPEPTVNEESSTKKKKKKKKDEPETKGKKKPTKAIKMMQELLKKKQEEEERLRREEEERIRKEEEAYQKKLAAIEEEKRKKEKKKQDKKERIERLKKEGKYLTPSQREAQRKREAYLKALEAQGIKLPVRGEQTKRPKYDTRKKKPKKEEEKDPDAAPEVEEEPVVEEKPEPVKEEIPQPKQEVEESESEDDWEAMADDDDDDDEESEVKDDAQEQEESSSSEEDEEESSSEEEDEVEEMSPREKVLQRIEKLREVNELKRSVKDLRSPVLCVMGHVDTGKTKILDKIRHTNVQDGEAGGITQQIGATNIPVEAIKEQTKMVQNFKEILVPGLLVIDTPGHESFSNLRSRGSSNCDMAILVVDIMHGLEPQTIESINMLRKKKTPYVVALNKVDRLYQWKANPKSDVVKTIKQQSHFTHDEFQKRVNEIIVQFAEQELNVKLFYENDDPDTWISMVPTSAHSGDGMGNLMAYVVHHCQSRLAKRLAYSENLQCTVLEVKAIQGLGTTVDVILTNGRLKYGDTIVLPGVEGPIVTHIKGLLMPQPLKELRVKNPYNQYKVIKAAQGVKVLAKELDKALAGTSLLVANHDDEIEILKDEVQAEVDQALKGIKLQDRGVFVQASTLGSLEALLEFLKQSKIPYAGINIGPVHKRDVMKASVMLEHDEQWAVILAFDVKVEREAQELADNLEVKIFTADIIYHLFDAFMKHREELKLQKQNEFRHLAVFPCKLKIVPNCVFKSRDPIVVGVSVEAGQLRVGTPVCVPNKDYLNVGIVASIEANHKPVEVARKGQEVCIKIEGAPGEAPKMVGRHFDEQDILTSKISRESIDLLKNWFRDEMQKSDWQLIIELKKLFEII